MIERKTLAEIMAEELKEAILAGVWEEGEALPTEPELARRFGVSRAVVRDATRIVMAWGLVEPRQGKGVFIRRGNGGFVDAMLLALRQSGASAWDVERVEWALYIEAAGLAAERHQDVNFQGIREKLQQYAAALELEASGKPVMPGEENRLWASWIDFVECLYAATDNALLNILGPAIARIRRPRLFQDSEISYPVRERNRELEMINLIIDAIESGNPKAARKATRRLVTMPREVVDSLRETPVGEVPRIALSLADLTRVAAKSEECP